MPPSDAAPQATFLKAEARAPRLGGNRGWPSRLTTWPIFPLIKAGKILLTSAGNNQKYDEL